MAEIEIVRVVYCEKIHNFVIYAVDLNSKIYETIFILCFCHVGNSCVYRE